MTPSGEEHRFDWRGGGAAAGALLATLVLLGMVFLVAMSNNARDSALESERRSYDITLLSRTVDATISRSEAALGRFVLDEKVESSGNIYSNQWRLAGHQIQQLDRLVARDPSQRQRVDELELIFKRRGEELAVAARAAVAKRGAGGTSLYYAAALSPTGPQLRDKLGEIAESERSALSEKMKETELFS